MNFQPPPRHGVHTFRRTALLALATRPRALFTGDARSKQCGSGPLKPALDARLHPVACGRLLAQADQGVALRVCRIAATPSGAPPSPADGAGSVEGAPDGAYMDVSGQWGAVREVGEGGAVLVRPDGHVAWRCHGGRGAAAAATELRTAVAATLCLPSLDAAPQ